MSYHELTSSLGDAFNVLADEVQGLNDRRTVLEHKLRFAHEQVSHRFYSYFSILSRSLEGRVFFLGCVCTCVCVRGHVCLLAVGAFVPPFKACLPAMGRS